MVAEWERQGRRPSALICVICVKNFADGWGGALPAFEDGEGIQDLLDAVLDFLALVLKPIKTMHVVVDLLFEFEDLFLQRHVLSTKVVVLLLEGLVDLDDAIDA